MATKSFIENKIYTNLADESDITAEKHREIEHLLLDEISPDPIVFSNEVPPDILLPLVPNMSFSGRISKHGRLVVINGQFTLTSGTLTGGELFQIVDSNYIAPFPQPAYCTARIIPPNPSNPSRVALMNAVGNRINIFDTLLSNDVVYFSFTYANTN